MTVSKSLHVSLCSSSDGFDSLFIGGWLEKQVYHYKDTVYLFLCYYFALKCSLVCLKDKDPHRCINQHIYLLIFLLILVFKNTQRLHPLQGNGLQNLI